MNNFELARLWYAQADAKRWQVARIAYGMKSRQAVLMLADAIGRGEDTVRNLRDAYALFIELVRDSKTSEPIRNLRRQYPYTRWAIVYRQWVTHEFELSEAREWLENFSGGNDALSAEIENKHGAPEWERRAYGTYKATVKLCTDFGVPENLQKAAEYFVKEFETWENNHG